MRLQTSCCLSRSSRAVGPPLPADIFNGTNCSSGFNRPNESHRPVRADWLTYFPQKSGVGRTLTYFPQKSGVGRTLTLESQFPRRRLGAAIDTHCGFEQAHDRPVGGEEFEAG